MRHCDDPFLGHQNKTLDPGWIPRISKREHLHPKAKSLQHLQTSVVDDGQHQAVHEHHPTEALYHVDDEVAWRCSKRHY